MAQLNGLEIAGRAIKVNVGDQITPRGGPGERDMGMGSLLEEEEGGAGLTAQSRASLMAKLSRGQSLPGSLPGMSAVAPSPAASSFGFGGAAAAAIPSTPVLIQSTTCVVIKNMFDPARYVHTPCCSTYCWVCILNDMI
jgi:hypothetical protein